MPNGPDPAVVKRTAQEILNDNALAVPMGADVIADDELVAVPDPAQYVAPEYLMKTAPHLAAEFGELLLMLREMNERFVGERTVDVQALLSLTGEHEILEEMFLRWCQSYFRERGCPERLRHRFGGNSWRIYQDCCREFHDLIEKRILQKRTINSSVLNLAQQFMLSQFTQEVMGSDWSVTRAADRRPHPLWFNWVDEHLHPYELAIRAYNSFIQYIGQDLPPTYRPSEDDRSWLADTIRKVDICAGDLRFFRNIPSLIGHETKMHRLADDLWARMEWDVYHGCSFASIRTSASQESLGERQTNHKLSLRRDGWLAHREYSWLRIGPPKSIGAQWMEIAVNWYVLDTLSSPLYEAWDQLDADRVVARGLEEDATEDEQAAAVTFKLSELPDLSETEQAVPRKSQRLVGQFRLTQFKQITIDHFQCTWTGGKGSEWKVFRAGYKMYTIGCHGVDRQIHSKHMVKCLKRLGISIPEFLATAP